MDSKTGKLIWQNSLSEAIGGSFIADKSIFIHSTINGQVAKLDKKTGKHLWIDNLGGRILSHPFIVKNGILFNWSKECLWI